jgi:hypothetical protein
MNISPRHVAWRDVSLQNLLQSPAWRSLALAAAAVGLLTVIFVSVLREILSPIRQYPGPFLASKHPNNDSELPAGNFDKSL